MKMKIAKKWTLPVTMVASLTIGAVGGGYVANPNSEVHQYLWGNKAEDLGAEPAAYDNTEWAKVERAYDLIYQQYVEEVGDTQLVEGAIQGMLSTLKDPYTVYMDKETAKQFDEALDSSFDGIGTEIGMENHKVIIVAPYKDSPADKAGLKPRDQIISIDGDSIEGLDLNETRLKIRGKKGTVVNLEIKRQGVMNPIKLAITRDEIPLDTVFSSVKSENGKNIGYIEITSFSQDTAADFKEQLKELEKEKISGLIIDVRGNPGGFLTSVESILGELLPKDKPYLQIEYRSGQTKEVFSGNEKKKDYPIAVLTDKDSASAAEILAGAMQEAGGYPLIGETTFGKGTVQKAIPMGDGSNIKITLYKWLTPNGNWIHQKGITPTIEVHQPSYFNVHPLTAEKIFKRDMNDEQIKNAQKILTSLGYPTGRADGYYDEKTETAVKAFQNTNDLTVSGNINSKTAAALEKAVAKKKKDEKNDLQLRTALKLMARHQ
ncbi:S41 family peptidase [Peribacillus sp. NPDC096379]|uniref:S41 family peptidase n=1 Tax=Peribacillus sp. NPDC096379 TaxID=3364393 RepID=UPI00382C5AC2